MQNSGVVHRKKGEQIRGYEKKNRGKFGGNFRRPPLAEFGAAVRYFADHTTRVGGTGVRSRRCRWCSGCRRSSAGYTEAGIDSREDSFGHHR